jgi:hypothetical protein
VRTHLCSYKGKARSSTCVYCRTPVGGEAEVHEGYLNLAQAVGISRVRDTSTCESFMFHHLETILKIRNYD